MLQVQQKEQDYKPENSHASVFWDAEKDYHSFGYSGQPGVSGEAVILKI